jgi:hypothetical protein
MATLQELLGGGLPAGLLSPEQEAAAERRAQNAALLNFAFGALQSSRGQPGQGAPSLGQIIGQAGPVGVQAYQQSFDQTLANTLRGLQLQDLQRKRQQEEAGRAAMQRLSQLMTGTTPEAALAAPGGQAGPTTSRAAMIGKTQPVNPNELIRMAFSENLPEDVRKNLLTAAQLAAPKEQKLPASYEEFLMSQRDPVFARYLQERREQTAPKINVNDPTAVDREIREINQSFTRELKDRGFTEVADRFSFLQSSVKQALGGNTRAHGAIIYNLGKIYDPSGAVQEGDKNTILGNRSIPESVRGIAERVLNGGTMTPNEIRGLYENVLINVQQRAGVAEQIAAGYKADVERLRPGGGQRIRSPFDLLQFDELPAGATVKPRNR